MDRPGVYGRGGWDWRTLASRSRNVCLRVDNLVVMRPSGVGFENRGYRLAVKGDRSFSTQDRLLEVHHLVVTGEAGALREPRLAPCG